MSELKDHLESHPLPHNLRQHEAKIKETRENTAKALQTIASVCDRFIEGNREDVKEEDYKLLL